MALRMYGVKELDAILRELPTATARATVRRVAIKAMQPVAETAKRMAPVDTGGLRDSIVVSTKLTKRQAKEARRENALGRHGTAAIHVYAGSDLPRAHLVEFGTAPHINGGKFKGSKHPGTAPNPFMRPAWDYTKDAVFEGLADSLREEIARVLGRAARRAATRAAKGA